MKQRAWRRNEKVKHEPQHMNDRSPLRLIWPPPPKSLPSVSVESVETESVMTSVELDDRLRAVQAKFNEAAEEEFRKRQHPDIPPPGKIEVLATDVDEQGRLWVT